MVLGRRTAGQSFFLSFVSGVICFGFTFAWMFDVTGYRLLHHAILQIYLGCYFGIFGLVYSLISKRAGAAMALFAVPFVWVSLEYIRSNMGFMAYPSTLLAHSQYRDLAIIQIASLTGAYGVSFLIVMVNSALAAMGLTLFDLANTPYLRAHRRISKTEGLGIVGVAVLLLVVSLTYGVTIISKPIVGKGVKISVIQGNIEQSKKWNPKYAEFIMQTYVDLTREALRDKPDLIVLPEAATPRSITLDRRLYDQVKHLAEEAGIPLLVGSSSHQKFKRGQSTRIGFRNSAFLISPEPRAKNQEYDKIRLLPFGEYMPMEKTIPWQWINVPNVSNYAPGKEFTVFEGPGFRFGVNICWETIFPDMVRQFVKRGAQLMVNITNEAWFGKTASPYQFLSINIFRAVENRVFLIRCANTGISCFIDPNGRIMDRVKNLNGEDIFVRGVLTGTVIPMTFRTLYTRYGDWFSWVCIGVSVIFITAASVRRKSGTGTMT
jgi:apolipoprotein N-acyltransferase